MLDLVSFPTVRAELRAFTDDVSGADLLPKHLRGRPADVYLTVMTGYELGLSPMQAIRSIHVIEGKPTLSADLMAALCTSRRDVCEYLLPVVLTSTEATYETKRVGWPAPIRTSFTIDDAKTAGLTGKDNWRKFPAAMLKARCLTMIVRAAYPDLMSGVYDPDEIDAPAQTGKADRHVVLDATPRPSLKQQIAAKTLEVKADEVDVEALRDQLASIIADDFEAAPSSFRQFLRTVKNKDTPDLREWKAPQLEWAVKALRNGMGAEFREFLAVDPTSTPPDDADPFGALDDLPA